MSCNKTVNLPHYALSKGTLIDRGQFRGIRES